MIEWIKDVLGINKYVVSYLIPNQLKSDPDWVLSGTGRFVGSKRVQELTAQQMNECYGEGTHWVERAP